MGMIPQGRILEYLDQLPFVQCKVAGDMSKYIHDSMITMIPKIPHFDMSIYIHDSIDIHDSSK